MVKDFIIISGWMPEVSACGDGGHCIETVIFRAMDSPS